MNIVVKHGINSQISNWWRLLIPCYAPERWTISLIHPRELEIFFRNKQSVIWLQWVLHLSLAQQLSSIFLSMYWLLATFMSCKKRVWEPADVVVYHWSKPTLGRTWFEVEIKILFKSFIWRHCLFKQRPLLLYQMVSAVLYIETSITCWHKTFFYLWIHRISILWYRNKDEWRKNLLKQSRWASRYHFHLSPSSLHQNHQGKMFPCCDIRQFLSLQGGINCGKAEGAWFRLTGGIYDNLESRITRAWCFPVAIMQSLSSLW